MGTEVKELFFVKAEHYTQHKDQFNQIGTFLDIKRMLIPRPANRKKNISKKSKS